MPETVRYRVTEAILVAHDAGSAWRITFTPEPIQPGASGHADGRLTVELLPTLVDNMFFDVSYSREEITALTEGTWDG